MIIRKVPIVFLLMTISINLYAENNEEAVIFNLERIYRFVNEAPIFIKGKSLKQLREIGRLKNESVTRSTNKYNSKTIDEFVTMKFEGLEIYAFKKAPDSILPIKITITSSIWKIKNGLNVGSPNSLILKNLGRPTKEYNNIKEYCGINDCIIFYSDKESISKIELSYYLD